MFCDHNVDVAQMIDDLAIDFLGNSLVEASIASFHVKYRNLSPFCRDYG